MEEQKSEQLQTEFEATAAPPPERVTVTLDLDADVLEWLKAQPLGWQREVNNAMRFLMETNLIREAAFDEASPTERPAYDIDSDYIPF
jgi:uncharacterized protein (DUF4415 family)